MSNLIKGKNIGLIAYQDQYQNQECIDSIFSSLRGSVKRDWFTKHAYFCTPLIMGNQHGFVLKSLYDFSVFWNGGESRDDVSIKILSDKKHYDDNHNLLSIKSHFGMQTFTVQTAYIMRTPNKVNLMTINPPNFIKDGIHYMTGVIETDNLRRDFTFNLAITRPNTEIFFHKGDILGCVIPYPRHYIDPFNFKNASDILSEKQIQKERECSFQHGIERSTKDIHNPGGVGRRYHKGEDVYGNKFKDHQTHLD